MRKRADVLERGLLIGGKSVPASSGKLADDVSPWDGEIYARVAAGTPADITRDLNAALDVVSRVRSGIIHINDQGIGDEPMAPFGGVKNSGYGKFGGTAGIESFTEQRWVTIQQSGRPTYPF